MMTASDDEKSHEKISVFRQKQQQKKYKKNENRKRIMQMQIKALFE